jgi:hypothetical protein
MVTRYNRGQSNVFTIHYLRPGTKPGSVFTRYILDDKWLGDYQMASMRRTSVLPEEGHFQGVQDRERAIGLYVPRDLNGMSERFSAKVVMAWSRWNDTQDKILVGGQLITDLPCEIPGGTTVVVESGEVMIAVRPLNVTHLSYNAPIRLVEKEGSLVLEIYNYLGPKRTFWELSWPGFFYQGLPRNGFYVEVASRSNHIDGVGFTQLVDSGTLIDEAEPPFTYDGVRPRLWRVVYTRDGRELGVRADLMDWNRPSKRWTQSGEMGQPMMESPMMRQSREGDIRVGGAALRCGKQPAWLFASPKTGRWVAGYHGPDSSPLVLEVESGKVEIDSIDAGFVVWDNGRVSLEAVGLKEKPRITGGSLVTDM